MIDITNFSSRYVVRSLDSSDIDEIVELCQQNEVFYDITDKRLHHEIYLSDARKVAPEKLKTVIRHPIKIKGE